MAGDSDSQGGGGAAQTGGGKAGVVELVFASSAEDEYARNPANNNITDTYLPEGSGGVQQQHATNMRKRASSMTGDLEIPAPGGHVDGIGGRCMAVVG